MAGFVVKDSLGSPYYTETYGGAYHARSQIRIRSLTEYLPGYHVANIRLYKMKCDLDEWIPRYLFAIPVAWSTYYQKKNENKVFDLISKPFPIAEVPVAHHSVREKSMSLGKCPYSLLISISYFFLKGFLEIQIFILLLAQNTKSLTLSHEVQSHHGMIIYIWEIKFHDVIQAIYYLYHYLFIQTYARVMSLRRVHYIFSLYTGRLDSEM